MEMNLNWMLKNASKYLCKVNENACCQLRIPFLVSLARSLWHLSLSITSRKIELEEGRPSACNVFAKRISSKAKNLYGKCEEHFY